jgi:hypothetical protein
MISIEYFWLSVCREGVPQRLEAEVDIHAVGEPPREHVAAVPVHDGHEIKDSSLHRYVGNVTATQPGPVAHFLRLRNKYG